ncbi:MAG: hypothetical protein AB7P03_08365 [Kofleriaceae bacterium]
MRSVAVALGALVLAAACGDGDGDPPLSDATSLDCPRPGLLPFRLETSGFQREENEALVKDNTRAKDEASDTLGNPGGAIVSIYAPDDQMPAAAAIEYSGLVARSTPDGGLFTHALRGEFVSLRYYDLAAQAWQEIGRTQTNEEGRYAIGDTGFVAANGQPLYAMVEADGTCTEHYNALLPAGANVIITDIDGTLTTSDEELFKQISDESHVPAMMAAADTLMQTWATKGYPIIYVTARPHLFRSETRRWLDDLGFPPGPVITAIEIGDTAGYKSRWLDRMFDVFGWVPVAAYGNADTDIIAYETSGIPKDRTFIVGPLAGMSGTVAIENNDFSEHISTFVAAQPDN